MSLTQIIWQRLRDEKSFRIKRIHRWMKKSLRNGLKKFKLNLGLTLEIVKTFQEELRMSPAN